MQKKKLIVGLTLSSIFVLSGTAMALTQGNGSWLSAAMTGNVQAVTTSTSASNITTLAKPTQPSQSTTDPATAQLPNNTPALSNGTTPNVNPGTGNSAFGYGMMGGSGRPNGNGGYGMMGGSGMMGGGYNAASLGISLPNGQVENSDQAIFIAKEYVQKLNAGLAVDELHEFSNSYEVELKDAKTGEKAFEFVIGQQGGIIFEEMGPNIMWNTQYGHMNWGGEGTQTPPTVSVDQATKTAQDYVAKMGRGYTVSKPETPPGYYEFMVMKDGKDFAELDVNGYSGQVWYENWHGPILNTVEAN